MAIGREGRLARNLSALTRKSPAHLTRMANEARRPLWRTLPRSLGGIHAGMFSSRRDESRRCMLKRAPQTSPVGDSTFIPIGGQPGHGDSRRSRQEFPRRIKADRWSWRGRK